MSDSNSNNSNIIKNNSINEANSSHDGQDDDSQKKKQHEPPQVLLTKKALALALSAPRAPPLGSAHRSLLLGQDPSLLLLQHHSLLPWTDHRRHYHYRVRESHLDIHNHEHEIQEQEQAGHMHVPHATLLQERLRQRLHRSHHYHYHLKPTIPKKRSHHHHHHRQQPPPLHIRRLPHPHLPAGPELGDQVTRLLGRLLPLSWQHQARDSGMARTLVDAIVTSSAPLLALQQPRAVVDFIQLSNRVQRVFYGSHVRQYIDLLEPNPKEQMNSCNNNSNTSTRSMGDCHHCHTRLIFFVHGGAWGSGQAWMYRLVAKAFLQQGYAVAILSYRVYPTLLADDNTNNDDNAPEMKKNNNNDKSATAAAVLDQVEDCQLAARYLQHHYPHYCNNVTVMGHSSGAHVSLYWLVERAKRQMNNAYCYYASSTISQEQQPDPEPFTIDSYIGLAGPYDISHHYDFEAARGVEEFSPMKPVCGYTRRNFRLHSPALNLLDSLAATTTRTSSSRNNSSTMDSNNNNNNSKTDVVVEHYFPPIVLVHGVEDETVPFTATAEAARVLRSCGVRNVQELYNESVQHQETVMQLMLGGVILEEILDWIRRLPPTGNNSSNIGIDELTSASSTTATRSPPVIRSKL